MVHVCGWAGEWVFIQACGGVFTGEVVILNTI